MKLTKEELDFCEYCFLRDFARRIDEENRQRFYIDFKDLFVLIILMGFSFGIGILIRRLI